QRSPTRRDTATPLERCSAAPGPGRTMTSASQVPTSFSKIFSGCSLPMAWLLPLEQGLRPLGIPKLTVGTKSIHQEPQRLRLRSPISVESAQERAHRGARPAGKSGGHAEVLVDIRCLLVARVEEPHRLLEAGERRRVIAGEVGGGGAIVRRHRVVA